MSATEKLADTLIEEAKEAGVFKKVFNHLGSFFLGLIFGVGVMLFIYFGYMPTRVPKIKSVTDAIENKDYGRGECLDIGYTMSEKYPTIFAEPFSVAQKKTNYSWKENEDEENND